ncbi:MAG: acetate/propionate family kinase [Proteobacteria bacterium]|nr:acetate/propionate family kinase [Pseudomonadota bacterium]
MSDAILVLNAGSSSIKFALFEYPRNPGDRRRIDRQAALSGQIDAIDASNPEGAHMKARDVTGRLLADQLLPGTPGESGRNDPHRRALDFLLGWLAEHDNGMTVRAVGHRVVHGAEKYAQPILLDAAVRDDLAHLIPLAPLHQPHNLDAIRAIAELQPELPQIACFDTAFHRSQPAVAQLFALPRAITEQGVRRYGFHGLSYEYIAQVLPEHLDQATANGRVIVAHLGNGASMCAMRGRRSVASTMGFTAIEGLMMGTRTGSIDPGVLLYLMDSQHMDAKALTRLLYKESGLLGVSGISSDMRVLLASDRFEAREAVELFCYRITREIGSLAASLGGLDALVFTGGIGDHAAPVRRTVCVDAGWLGVELDEVANSKNAICISSTTSRVRVLVLPTNEEWIIARHTAALIK